MLPGFKHLPFNDIKLFNKEVAKNKNICAVITELVQGEGGLRWQLRSLYERLPVDGLPADAWTALLTTRAGAVSTRVGARPLNAEEQGRVLLVGACLECHDPERDARVTIFRDFAVSLKRLTSSCRRPD